MKHAPSRLALFALVLAAGCAGPTAGAGAPDAAAPASPMDTSGDRATTPDGINDGFLSDDLDPMAFVNRWEVESREIYASRDEILDAIGLQLGDRIADIGSGTGLFLAPFSEAVGDAGQVLAVDISPNFIEHLRARVADEGLENVTVVHSREDSATLPTASADAAFVCDTYHHFTDIAPMLGSLRDALRPGGTLVVVNFERIPGVSREWILGHVRAGKQTFRAEIQAHGFDFVEEVEVAGLEENYFLRFVRP